LHQQIGQLQVELDWLKKESGLSRYNRAEAGMDCKHKDLSIRQ
jgi:hypothetical protein